MATEDQMILDELSPRVPFSAREIAEELRLPLGRVRYVLSVLHRRGLVSRTADGWVLL